MKHEPRPAIHMEKVLGWARKLGGAESVNFPGVSNSVSHVDGVSPLPTNNPPCDLYFCASVPVLVVCLVFFGF